MSMHGAMTPYILNIIHDNRFRINYDPKVVASTAGGKPGLFHSNKLQFPYKYAFPSPLVLQDDAFHKKGWEKEDGELYISMLELRVNPLQRCKGKKWHFTMAKDVPRCVHIAAVHFGIYTRDRSFKYTPPAC